MKTSNHTCPICNSSFKEEGIRNIHLEEWHGVKSHSIDSAPLERKSDHEDLIKVSSHPKTKSISVKNWSNKFSNKRVPISIETYRVKENKGIGKLAFIQNIERIKKPRSPKKFIFQPKFFFPNR